MADTTESVRVEIVAVIKDLLNPLKQAKDAVGETAGSMKGSLDGLQGAFSGLGKAFGMVAGLAAGGAMFKAAIDATVKWTGDAGKLSRQLGITTQEASYLKVALHGLGADSDTYTKAAQMMTRQINSGGEGFKKLGVEIKDSNGHLKPTTQLMAEVTDKIGGLKKGIDQQAAGMAIFGRGWSEAQKLMRLTTERMAEAKKEAEELHLVVGPEGAAKTREYQEGLRKLGLIKESLMIQVGQQLLPVLVQLGAWLGKTGPAMAEGLAVSLKVLVGTFYVLKAVIENVTNVLVAAAMTIIDGWALVGKVLWRVMQGDFKGAVAAAKEEATNIKNEWAASAEGIVQSWKDAGAAIADLSKGKAPGKAADAGKGGNFNPDAGKKDGDSRLRGWMAELKAQQDTLAEEYRQQGKFYEMSLAEEKAFWAKKAAMQGLSEKERAAITIKMADLDRAARKEDLQARLASLQESAEADRFNLQRKRELAIQEQGMYREGTAAYEAARRKVLAIDREIEQERRALMVQQVKYQEEYDLAIADLNIQKLQAMADEESADRVKNLQEIQAFELQKIEIKRASLQAQLEDFKGSEEARRELENRINMLGLEERRLTLQQQTEMNKTMAEGMRELFSPVTEAWNTAMAGMLKGTMTLGQGWKTLLQGMGKMLDQAVMQMVNSWIAAETKKLAITAAAKIKELILHQSTAAATIATTTTTATAQVTAAGAVAGANAAASAAQTPMYGWAIAVPAGLAVLAAVMALKGRIGSAAGGWERVPHDQMAMIHKDEQVLPAKYAEGLRNLVENGGAGQQAPAFAPSFNITALDARGVERVLRDNNSAVGQAVRDYARNFGRS